MHDRILKWSAKNEQMLFFLVLAANVLLILNYYSWLTPWELDHYYFNADTLYLPSIYRDLVHDGNSLEGWTLNAAPNFFPDALLYFLIMSFTDNIPLVAMLFSMIQYLVMALCFAGICKVVVPQDHLLTATAANVLLALFFFVPDTSFTFQMLSNAYHLGAFVNALIAWNLLLRLSGNGKLILPLLLIILLGAVSDKLFHIIFTIPALFAWTILAIKKRRFLWKFPLSVVVGAALAMVMFDAFPGWTGSRFAETQEIPRFHMTASSFGILGQQLFDYLAEFNVQSLLVILLAIALVLSTISGVQTIFRRQVGPVPITLWKVLVPSMMVLVFFVPPVVGSYTGWDSIRYNFAVFAISPLILAVYSTVRWVGRVKPFIAYLSLFLPLLAFVLILWPNKEGTGFSEYIDYYPERVEKIDAHAHEFGSRYGVANFWDAKVITMFSKKGLRVYAAFEDLAAYEHVINRNWFRRSMDDPGRPADFRFVIPNEHMPIESITWDMIDRGVHISDWPAYMIVTPPFKYVDEHRRPILIEP